MEAADISEEAMTGRLRRLLGPYRLLPGNRNLALLFSGQIVSSLGSWLYVVALVVLTYNITHSATVVALLTFVRLLPFGLFLPFTGYLADKLERKALMIGADLGRGVCMFGLLLVHSRSTLWIAFPLIFVNTSLSSVFRPALNAVLPALVSSDDLPEANGLMSQMDSLSIVLGPSLGGVLILLGSIQAAFLVNGASFVVSAATLFLLRFPKLAAKPAESAAGWIEELLGGFRFIFRENDGVLAGYTLSVAGMTLMGGAYWTLIIILSERVFHLGGQGNGFLNAAYGAGGLLGGFLSGAVKKVSMTQIYLVSSIFAGLSIVALGFSPSGALPFMILAAAGIADVLAQISGTTIIQGATPAELMGRVFGAFESVLVLAMLVGTLMAGPLIQWLGPRTATWVFGVAGLVVLAACLPWLFRLKPVLGVRMFLRSVPVTAGLSRRMLDEVASLLQMQSFGPETVIVRQGEPGDRLYLIRSGEADVLAAPTGTSGNPVVLGTIGKMDYFGEIALLRDVPRTATVRSRGAVETYSLSREDFQHLVGRSPELQASIAGTADARYIDTQNKLLLRM